MEEQLSLFDIEPQQMDFRLLRFFAYREGN